MTGCQHCKLQTNGSPPDATTTRLTCGTWKANTNSLSWSTKRLWRRLDGFQWTMRMQLAVWWADRKIRHWKSGSGTFARAKQLACSPAKATKELSSAWQCRQIISRLYQAAGITCWNFGQHRRSLMVPARWRSQKQKSRMFEHQFWHSKDTEKRYRVLSGSTIPQLHRHRGITQSKFGTCRWRP